MDFTDRDGKKRNTYSNWLKSGWFGPDRPLSEKPKPDGWLSGDEALTRYAKAPDTITQAVEAERVRHLKCATDEKPLRVDVERIMDAKICYLEFTCGGCGMSRRVQVNETNGNLAVISESYQNKPMTKEEKIALNVKANAEGRTKYPQIYMPKIESRPSSGFRNYYSSATRFTAEIFDNDGAKAATAKPLVSGGGKITRKPEPKAPPKPLIDRLRIVRAAPAHDEEV